MSGARTQGRTLEVKVPGKIFLAGEYAVLKGGRAHAAAVGAFLTLTLEETELHEIWVHSNIWPEARLLTPAPVREPLLDSLQSMLAEGRGARVEVQSELDLSYGLGSSSAVRLAAHLAAHAFRLESVQLSHELRWQAAREAWLKQKSEQGFASGYDLVTQLQGGCVSWTPDYDAWPGSIQSRDTEWISQHVRAYVGGKGAPTASVGGGVRAYLDSKGLWPSLLEASEPLVSAFQAENIQTVISANTAHRALFEDAPFYPARLRNLLASLSGFDRSWSFKTTGAGGEDAILLLGPTSELGEADATLRQEGWHALPYSFTTKGSTMRWKD